MKQLLRLLILSLLASRPVAAEGFGPPQVVPGLAKHVHAADLDGDGDNDLLETYTGTGGGTYWSENLDGLGSFGPRQPLDPHGLTQSSFPADMDGDGDIDVLTAWGSSQFSDMWFMRNQGGGEFVLAEVFDTGFNLTSLVFGHDLDADGDADILTCSFNPGWSTPQISWLENLDGAGTFGFGGGIDSGSRAAFPADLDGDGDADLLAAEGSISTGRVLWFENLGSGVFSTEHVITTAVVDARSVFAADLDGDGLLDALSASTGDDKIAWYRNLGHGKGFGSQQVITTAANGAVWVWASDLDEDGDSDVLSSKAFGGAEWYENIDGRGGFGPPQLISAGGTASVVSADLDGDGDCDIVSGGNAFRWNENLGDPPDDICTNCTSAPDFDVDTDADGFLDACDNCDDASNVDQANDDDDAFGDACDTCPGSFNGDNIDSDSDMLGDACDNCDDVSNIDQANDDADPFGDACDTCLGFFNVVNTNSDSDALGDACDNCDEVSNVDQANGDADDFGNACDNCTGAPNFTPTIAGFETIHAPDTSSFCWDHPTGIVWLRGPLADVSTYTIHFVLIEPFTACIATPEDPPPGEGYYYVVRADCPDASWQTRLGAEPLRDLLWF